MSMMLNESGKLRRAPYQAQQDDDRTLDDKLIAGSGIDARQPYLKHFQVC